MAYQHRLSDIDTTALTARCAICGPGTPLERSGTRYLCKPSRQEHRRQYKNRNGNSNTVSPHALHGTDICRICGPVVKVPWGSGWMCPNRAVELGWTPPTEPNPRCHRCQGFLTDRGICLDCTPIPLPKDLLESGGFGVGEMRLSRRVENAVPGWTTIGPPLDPGSPWAAYLT